MYGFFPPEEAVPTLIVLFEETALTFFRRTEEEFTLGLFRATAAGAEEDVALTLFRAAGTEAAPTVFVPVEGDASSCFAPAVGGGKKKFSSSTSCCPVWTSRCGSRKDNAPAD